jgi:hypothetical protein
MQFTKPMIELVFEIRRYAPSDLKPAVKLANPELFAELQTFYHSLANTITKALIKELFYLAGDHWPSRLESPELATPVQTVRVYRGQVQMSDQPPQNPIIESPCKPKPKTMIYRGQSVLG